MLHQIRQLTAIQLCNFCGINEARYTHDRKKKRQTVLLAFVWIMLTVMLLFYMILVSHTLAELGMAEMIPILLFTVTSLTIFCFSIFKAGSVIFQMSSFELLASLPVSKSAIVISRFLTMYSTNLILSVLIMFSGAGIYGMFVRPPVSFYIFSLLGTIVLPLLPMTIATTICAIITAISSRMKHKNWAQSILTLLFILAIIIGNTFFSADAGDMTTDQLKNLALLAKKQMQTIYPPAMWFGSAAISGSIGALLALVSVSILVFVCMMFIIQHYFMRICTALHASSAKNDYKMQRLHSSSVRRTLWRRELKRYFASSIYVTNTMVGYILMSAAAAAMLFLGVEKIETSLQLPGDITSILPLILSVFPAILSTTCCSISLEGKQWWIAQTIPVRSKDIFDSKILVNLTIAFPWYLISVIFVWLAVRPSLAETIWLAVMPAAYILFSSVAGLTVNLAMPVLEWENETRVVKQSASTMVSMLIGFASFLPPLIVIFSVPTISATVVMAATLGVLLLFTLVLYRHNNKKRLFAIG